MRAATSAVERSPSRRRRSWTASASRARRSGARREPPGERPEVERLLEALAVRLEDDREAGRVAGRLEEVLAALPLEMEERPPAGPPSREEERARRALAESPREEPAPPERPHDE